MLLCIAMFPITIADISVRTICGNEDWQGIRVPVCAVLYNDYEVPLDCGRLIIHYGVLGFYHWFGDIVSSACCFAVSIQRPDKPKATIACVISGILTMLQYAGRIGIFFGSARQCHGSIIIGATSTLLDTFLTANVIISFVSMIGAFFVSIDNRKIEGVVPVIQGITLAARIFSTAMYYRGYSNFLYIDRSLISPIMAVSAVPMVQLIAILAICWILFTNYDIPVVVVLIYVIIMSGVIFHTWGTGMAAVLFGRIMDDVYGTKDLQDPLAKLGVVITGVFPILNIAVLVGSSA